MADSLEFANGILQGLSDVTEPVAVLWSGGKASSLLWELCRAHLQNPNIVYIDHGLHTPETIKLLHQLHRSGIFKIQQSKFYRNDPALLAIRSGEMSVSLLPKEEQEWVHSVTSQTAIPYSLSHPVVRRLLIELPMERVYQDYHWVITGDRAGRRPGDAIHPSFEVRGKTIILRPLWWFTEAELWSVLLSAKLPVNDRYAMGYRTVDTVEDPQPTSKKPAWEQTEEGQEWGVTIPLSPLLEVAEKAVSMAEPSRSEFIDKEAARTGLDPNQIKAEVKRILSTLKGGNKFGWKPPPEP